MKNLFKISTIIVFIFLIHSCEDKPIPPVLTTAAVTEISNTTAISGGDVTSEEGAPIISRGVCWNTSAGPTISNNKTTESGGLGAFTSNITQLTANTKYYVRAYATNSAGTGYGNEVSFTTNHYPMIRLKSGTGLNSGAHIYFLALSKNVNYFNLTTDEMFAYRKTDADWYIDGDMIPFTTAYKELNKATGTYYLLLSGSGTVLVTTITIRDGEQTIIVSGATYGGINITVVQPKKSGETEEPKPKQIEYFIPGQTKQLIQK